MVTLKHSSKNLNVIRNLHVALYLTGQGQQVNLKCLSVLDFLKTKFHLIQFELTICHKLYMSTSKTEDVKDLT